jgi:hypothetical protein
MITHRPKIKSMKKVRKICKQFTLAGKLPMCAWRSSWGNVSLKESLMG